jgi:prepilin-type N-terminal cleavage/methylation domain-containing protein
MGILKIKNNKQLKSGYTMIEIMLVLVILTSITTAGFILYSQYTSVMVEQTKISNSDTALANTFMAINLAVQQADELTQIDNTVYLGSTSIRIEDNTLYLGNEALITNDNMSIYVDEQSRFVEIQIGGEEYCFRRIANDNSRIEETYKV